MAASGSTAPGAPERGPEPLHLDPHRPERAGLAVDEVPQLAGILGEVVELGFRRFDVVPPAVEEGPQLAPAEVDPGEEASRRRSAAPAAERRLKSPAASRTDTDPAGGTNPARPTRLADRREDVGQRDGRRDRRCPPAPARRAASRGAAPGGPPGRGRSRARSRRGRRAPRRGPRGRRSGRGRRGPCAFRKSRNRPTIASDGGDLAVVGVRVAALEGLRRLVGSVRLVEVEEGEEGRLLSLQPAPRGGLRLVARAAGPG